MEANEVIDRLKNELLTERAKNAVLLEKLMELEDGVVDSRLKEFEDVIPNEDRDYWRGQFLENGTAAAEFLGRLRNRLAAVPAEAPEAAAPAAKVPPRPMHNRAAAPTPKAAPLDGAAPAQAADRAARIRNRAQEIASRDRISFSAAFSRAEREIGG